MKLSRRTNTIILWITSIGLLVGMVITFTPTLGALTGGGQNDTSAPALIVNGETISDLEVAQARRSSPIFNVVQEGPVAEDLELLLVDQLIRQEVLAQAASRMRVGSGQVREELQAFRERNAVAGSRNDEAYLRLIGGAGYTDATFRDYLRDQLQVAAFQEEVTEGVDVDASEVEAFYRVNIDAYRSDPRVLARQIVVDDVETAEALRVRALAGESFGELAAEASLERADQNGAVGGETPQPVGRPAFPSVVADAVFARSTAGLTPVVESGGRAYLVQVEEIVPASPRPLDEVRDEVREDALAAKRQAALNERIEELVAEAEVSVADGAELSLDDPVVATVGSLEIHASELARETYTNPQIQQALSPQTASLIAQFFKPSILEQLVDRELAVQGSERLDATFFGSDALIAQSVLDWVARDAEATESEIEAFYQGNLDRYTVAASADVLRVDFGDAPSAAAFRDALLNGAEPEAAAEEAGGEVENVGVVRQGQLAPPLDTALFATDAFESLPGDPRAVSDVLVLEVPVEPEAPAEQEAPADEASQADETTSDEATSEQATEDAETPEAAPDTDGEAAATPEGDPEAGPEAGAVETTHVVLVALRTPQRVRPLEEVRSDVEATVLAQERQSLQREWLNALREEIPVETMLASATPPATPATGATDDGAEPAEDAGTDGDAAESDATDGETTDGETTDDETIDGEATDAEDDATND